MQGGDLIDKARQFATAAHRGVGQTRKYTGEPYEEHLRRVAALVEAVTGDPEMVAAAWLHDVVEDTPVTIEEIGREFGPRVRELVDALTDVSQPHHGNRAIRKAMDREHLAAAPDRAQTVKLADLIDNCDDICRHNRGFGRIFLAEMGQLLEVLQRGDPKMIKRARNMHAKWSQKLPKAAPRAEAGALTAEEIRARVGPALDHVAHAFRAREIASRLAPGFEPPADVAPAQLVPEDAPLTAVVEALDRHETCYTTAADGQVVGRLERAHMQGPVVRMWLFGMVTTLEWIITEDIRAAQVDWPAMISPARLNKAAALRDARAASGRPVALLDCLQLADKVRIHRAIDTRPHPLLRGASKEESQRLVRDLEDLRNSLAHAQDIVTHDWTQIVRLARRLEELAAG